MKTNRSVKKVSKVNSSASNCNKSLLNIRPKDASFLLQDQSQQLVIKSTKHSREHAAASTHRIQSNTRPKINVNTSSVSGVNTGNSKLKNPIVQSTKNYRRENSHRDLIQGSQNSRPQSARSVSQENYCGPENESKPLNRKSSRPKSGQVNKRKKQSLHNGGLQEDPKPIKKKVIKIPNLDSPDIISNTQINKRESFFEREYRDLQQQLLQTKSEFYEQIYKTDCITQKYNQVKNDIAQIQQKYEKERDLAQKSQQRNHRYKDKYLKKKEEIVLMQKDFEEIVNQRNDEINRIKESIEQTMREFFTKGEKAAFLTKDLGIKLHQMQKLLKEERQMTNHRMISQLILDAIMFSDKIFEYLRIYDINGKFSSIDYQTLDNGSAQQTIEMMSNDNSLCNFYNNYINAQSNDNPNDNALSGYNNNSKFDLEGQQQKMMIENQQKMLEEMRARIDQMEAENANLREEKQNLFKHFQRKDVSMRTQDKVLNQSQNQQQSFQYNNKQYSTAMDTKSGASQIMGPLLISGTDTHFNQNKAHAATSNYCHKNPLIDHTSLIQSDPGMQFYFNQVTQERSADYTQNQQMLQEEDLQQLTNADNFYNQNTTNTNTTMNFQKVPPLLMIKDPLEYNQASSDAQSTIRTAINSTTNQAGVNFKNKLLALSPSSTLSMQHIQLSNYRSPIMGGVANNASSFTLCQNTQFTDGNSDQQPHSIIQHTQLFPTVLPYPQHQANNSNSQAVLHLQNYLYDPTSSLQSISQSHTGLINNSAAAQQQQYYCKNSGRSHETSTFQQNQDFLESLKEVGEEAEDDESMIIRNRSLRVHQHQYEGDQKRSNNQGNSYDYGYEGDGLNESKSRCSNSVTPSKMNEANKENIYASSSQNSQSAFITTTNDYDSLPVDKSLQSNLGTNIYLNKLQQNKDTIMTTNSQILSERTMNLKKEINNLDDEIYQLQSSLQNAIAKRQQTNN